MTPSRSFVLALALLASCSRNARDTGTHALPCATHTTEGVPIELNTSQSSYACRGSTSCEAQWTGRVTSRNALTLRAVDLEVSLRDANDRELTRERVRAVGYHSNPNVLHPDTTVLARASVLCSSAPARMVVTAARAESEPAPYGPPKSFPTRAGTQAANNLPVRVLTRARPETSTTSPERGFTLEVVNDGDAPVDLLTVAVMLQDASHGDLELLTGVQITPSLEVRERRLIWIPSAEHPYVHALAVLSVPEPPAR